MRVTALVALSVLLAGASGLAQHQAPAAGHQKPDHMDHRFDDPERYAKSFDDPARDAWQMPARVVDTLDLRAGQSIADIGAGTGYFSVRLARTAAKPTVYAVDIEPKMVAYLKARAAGEALPNLEAVQATSVGPNLPAPVDVVLIVDTYHHIPKRVDYFKALRSSIKPGGRLAIIDFRKDAPEGPPVEFRFTPDQISAELKQAGFALAATYDFLPRQMFLIYQAE